MCPRRAGARCGKRWKNGTYDFYNKIFIFSFHIYLSRYHNNGRGKQVCKHGWNPRREDRFSMFDTDVITHVCNVPSRGFTEWNVALTRQLFLPAGQNPQPGSAAPSCQLLMTHYDLSLLDVDLVENKFLNPAKRYTPAPLIPPQFPRYPIMSHAHIHTQRTLLRQITPPFPLQSLRTRFLLLVFPQRARGAGATAHHSAAGPRRKNYLGANWVPPYIADLLDLALVFVSLGHPRATTSPNGTNPTT